jgi:hypothetical protein
MHAEKRSLQIFKEAAQFKGVHGIVRPVEVEILSLTMHTRLASARKKIYFNAYYFANTPNYSSKNRVPVVPEDIRAHLKKNFTFDNRTLFMLIDHAPAFSSSIVRYLS